MSSALKMALASPLLEHAVKVRNRRAVIRGNNLRIGECIKGELKVGAKGKGGKGGRAELKEKGEMRKKPCGDVYYVSRWRV